MDMLLMSGRTSSKIKNELKEDKVQQLAPGHPRQCNRNARPPPRSVRDDKHVAVLKLNIPTAPHISARALYRHLVIALCNFW
jgi:hypothetical protein